MLVKIGRIQFQTHIQELAKISILDRLTKPNSLSICWVKKEAAPVVGNANLHQHWEYTYILKQYKMLLGNDVVRNDNKIFKK